MAQSTSTKKPTATPKAEDNVETLVRREEVIEGLKNELERRFNELRDQAMTSTNVWDHHDIDVVLKELKFVYENILR